LVFIFVEPRGISITHVYLPSSPIFGNGKPSLKLPLFPVPSDKNGNSAFPLFRSYYILTIDFLSLNRSVFTIVDIIFFVK